ncbi:MAG: prepilin-type N-terminal cleavage/methylation domain-containing protein [Vicinamibacterales bacterium]
MTLRPCGGFSLVELLVALVVCALLTGAVAGLLSPARAAFEATPAALDLHQRARAGLDLLTTVVRSAGANVGAADGLGALANLVPVVMPLPSPEGNLADGEFGAVWVMSVAPDAAQGRLDRDQPGPAGALTLAPSPACPQVSDVCGFKPGDFVAIVDPLGRFEVLAIASTNAAGKQLSPAAALTQAYPAGSLAVEAEINRFALAVQPDGSRSLVRVTSAGATQPIVDGVSRAGFVPWGEAAAPELRWDGASGWASYGPSPLAPTLVDPQGEFPPGDTCVATYNGLVPRTRLASVGERGTLVPFARSDLDDGPWCSAAVDGGRYDADLFRLRRLDVWLRVEVLSATLRGPAGYLFNRSGSARAPIKWVPDLTVRVSVALRNAT